MGKVKRTIGLFRRSAGRAPPSDDAADHGTAFGLEMSIVPWDDDAAPKSPIKPARRASWVQRLASRARQRS